METRELLLETDNRLFTALILNEDHRPSHWLGTRLLLGARLVFSRQLACNCAMVALLCIVCVFFFPASHGSYSAVHGPVTALRALQIILALWLLMAVVTLRKLGCGGRVVRLPPGVGLRLPVFVLRLIPALRC